MAVLCNPDTLESAIFRFVAAEYVEQGIVARIPSNTAARFHSNLYCAQSACEHCSGVIRHESWCITVNPVVYYAYEAVLDADKLSMGDVLALHSLGVQWTGKSAREPANCKSSCGHAQRDSRSGIQLERRPIKRIVKRAAAQQRQFRSAQGSVRARSLIQLVVELTHQLLGGNVGRLP